MSSLIVPHEQLVDGQKIPNDIANVDPRSPDISRPVTLQKSAMILLIEPDSFSTPEAQILPYTPYRRPLPSH